MIYQTVDKSNFKCSSDMESKIQYTDGKIFPKNSILSKNASDLKIIGMEPIYIMKFFNRWNFFNGRKF